MSTPDPVPLSLPHLSDLEVPPADFVAFAGRAGFASVGLRLAPTAPGGIAYPLAGAAEQAEVRRRCAAGGVAVLHVELVSLGEHTDPAHYEPMLAAGAALGATRVVAAGDSPDFGLVADRLARLCELARGYGLAAEIEFMPFRPVRSFADAAEVVRRSGQPDAHVLVDALHVFRSASPLEDIAGAPPALIGSFQLCDAPAAAPPAHELPVEARTRRLLPGEGDLPLRDLLAALPPATPIGVEVPLATRYPDLPPPARIAMLARAAREFLQGSNA